MKDDDSIRQEFLTQWNLIKSELHNYILYYALDQDLADDIMQSTAEIAYKKYNGQINTEFFKYKLFNIAKRKFFEYNRKMKKQSKEVSFEILKEGLFTQSNQNQAEDIADILTENELKEDLKKIISQLTGFDQQLIVLRYKKSLSFKKLLQYLANQMELLEFIIIG